MKGKVSPGASVGTGTHAKRVSMFPDNSIVPAGELFSILLLSQRHYLLKRVKKAIGGSILYSR